MSLAQHQYQHNHPPTPKAHHNVEERQHKTNTRAHTLLIPMPVFSPQSWDELKHAIEALFGPSSEGSIRLNGPIGEWNVTKVTDMAKMFNDMDVFNYDLSNWDVSRVNDMAAMFAYARAFNREISMWDVSLVTNMRAMFAYAHAFNQALSNWDVSRVADMAHMFNFAKAFNQDLSEWDVSRVTDMNAMFANAHVFNRALSKWDVSRVTNMRWMFAGADSFQQVLCGAAWVDSTASKIDMFDMSPGAVSGACVHWHFICSFLLFSFLPTHARIGASKRSYAQSLIHVHSHHRPVPTHSQS